MEELKIFEKSEFGQIRVIEKDGIPYFVANDVAKALGYTNPSKATNDHCKKSFMTWGNDSLGRHQEFKVIPEGDIYRLIVKSQLPSAEKFETWIFDEVLPTLRKTGTYKMPNGKETKPKKKNLSSINMAAKIMKETYKEAGVEAKYIAVAIETLYREEAGINFKIPILSEIEKLYDCTEMAKELKVVSNSGKPHNKAISAIIQKLNIIETDIVMTVFNENGHEGVTAQYKPPVLKAVKQWLSENNYPCKITYIDNNGNKKTYTVIYKDIDNLQQQTA